MMGNISFGSEDLFDLSERQVKVRDMELPFTVKHHEIFAPGNHNDMFYSKELIQKSFRDTNWDKKTRSIFLDHDDDHAKDWAGYVNNMTIDALGKIYGDLEVWDLSTALKLMGGAKFGVSPSFRGIAKNNVLEEGYFRNFSIVVNPAVKTTYLNSEIKKVEEEQPKGDENMSDEEAKTQEAEIKIEPTPETTEPAKEEVKVEEKVEESKPEPVVEEKKTEAVMEDSSKKVLDKLESIEGEVKKMKEDKDASEKTVADTKVEKLEQEMKELKSKMDEPERSTVSALEKELSDDDVDRGMLNVLRHMEGLPPVKD